MLNEKVVLITGGTGSFGRAFVKRILPVAKKVIVFSRDEYKQSEMAKEFPDPPHENLRFFLGDVRDLQRLRRAFWGVDYVIHAAALKRVPALEYNPTEAIQTNIDGSVNVTEAAIDCGVEKVIALSTDKAVNPINLYGSTKLCMEKIFTAANVYSDTLFACVRYGNVIGSRGSVIPFFQKLKGPIPITHESMTRFWLTLGQAVDLVLLALDKAEAGDILVPYIPAMAIVELAKTINVDCKFKFIGVRPGEKIHECLVSEDNENVKIVTGEFLIPAGEIYTSDKANQLTREEMRGMLCSTE